MPWLLVGLFWSLVRISSDDLLTASVFHCKTHTYLIILNRQRLEKQAPQIYSHQASPTATSAPSYYNPVNTPTSAHHSPISTKASLRGRALVLSSSEDLLTAFLFLHTRVPAALISWTMGQQAFNACMILLLDAMETVDLSRIGKVEKVYVVFTQLEKNGVHELATLAVERISWGLVELGRMKKQAGACGVVQPMEPARGRMSRCDMDMQGAAGSEAMLPGVMHDTVMGNTGMLLLEDPGLQSFVPEAFAPLTWALGREDHTRGVQARERVKQEQGQARNLAEAHGRQLNDDASSIEAVRTAARSSEQMQGGQGSAPGSAPTRYATFGSAPHPSQQPPQGLTSPTSPPQTVGSMVEQQRREPEMGLQQLPPPHLRHNSYPSVQYITASIMADQQSFQRKRVVGPNVGTLGSHNTERERAWDVNVDMARIAPLFSTSHVLLQTTPDCTPASTSTTAQLSPNVHPSWAARPAIPASRNSDSAPNLSQPIANRQHMVDGGQRHIPVDTPQQLPTHTWQYTLPFSLSSASGEIAPAMVGQMDVEEWRACFPGHGAA
jgi:hypothetical protein